MCDFLQVPRFASFRGTLTWEHLHYLQSMPAVVLIVRHPRTRSSYGICLAILIPSPGAGWLASFTATNTAMSLP